MQDNTRYNYFLSLTSQFYFCGIPYRLDTKPKCELNCGYCFAMSRGGRRTNTSLIADSKSLDRLFDKIDRHKVNSLNTELLSKKYPIHFGGMSDPFDSVDSIKISTGFLRVLMDRGYPTVLSTKNTEALLSPKIIEIIRNFDKIIIQISFSSLSEKFTNILEPNVPTALERIDHIKTLKKFNIPIVVRLQPIFPNLIEEISNLLIPALNDANIDHLILEHLKLPVERNISMIKEIEMKTGWNLYSIFEDCGAKLIGREWLLPNELKFRNIQKIISNLSSSITISYADYGLQHFGDTKCCCGIDKFWINSNWFNGNIVNCIKENSDLKICSIELLDNFNYPKSSIARIMNSNSRKAGSNTIKSYLVNKWNSPGTINAPDHLLGVSYIGKDLNGNCLYNNNSDEI